MLWVLIVVLITQLGICQTSQNCMLKQVNLTVCKLYLKQNGK